jgi:hypothetical protein
MVALGRGSMVMVTIMGVETLMVLVVVSVQVALRGVVVVMEIMVNKV